MFHASFACACVIIYKTPALGNVVIKSQDFLVSTHVIRAYYIQKLISYKSGRQPNIASVYEIHPHRSSQFVRTRSLDITREQPDRLLIQACTHARALSHTHTNAFCWCHASKSNITTTRSRDVVKIQFILEQATKAQKGSRCVALLFLHPRR